MLLSCERGLAPAFAPDRLAGCLGATPLHHLQQACFRWRFSKMIAAAPADQDLIRVAIGQWAFDNLGASLVRSSPVPGEKGRVTIDLRLDPYGAEQSVTLEAGVSQPLPSGSGVACPLEGGWWYVWVDYEVE